MDDLHSPCVGMGDGLTASDLRAEIARLRVEVLARSEDLSAAMARTNGLEEANRTLRAELDAERFKRAGAESAYELLSIQSASVVRELERTERELASARAALDEEREAIASMCDEQADLAKRAAVAAHNAAYEARRKAEEKP